MGFGGLLELPEKLCPWCGDPLPLVRPPAQKFCMAEHATLASQERARKRGAAQRDAARAAKASAVAVVADGARPRADGRGLARRGVLYEEFVGAGWAQKIADGLLTHQEVMAAAGASQANVSRWMAAFEVDRAAAMLRERWSRRPEHEAMLQPTVEAFASFRAAFFRDNSDRPYLTPTVHVRWISALLEALRTGGRQIILSPPRHGKAVADETPMMTSRGWVVAGEVRVGDELVGSDGRFTKVTARFPQGEVDLFDVSFSDGSRLRTCGEHRWLVTQRYGGPARVRTTAGLGADLVEVDDRAKWRIPMMAPFEGFDRALPLDPYVFGMWLGDGHRQSACMTVGDLDVAHVQAQVLAAGYSVTSAKRDERSGAWRVQIRSGPMRDGFGSRVMRMALAAGQDPGHSLMAEKFIPEEYLTASIADRLALLQGLCDTDGSVAKNGSQQSFCSTSPMLAEGFRRLVSSLGGTWTQRVRPAAAKTAWEIYFRLPEGMAAFRLERKRARLASWSARNEPRRLVKSVVPAGRGQATCFTVDADDHLFAAGESYVMTHNTDLLTHFGVWMICQQPNIRIIWVGGNEDIARNAVGAVMDQLENNEALIAAMLGPGGSFKPQGRTGKSWTNKLLTVGTRTVQGIKSATITALGKGGRLLSRDADLIVFDDIVDYESASMPASRKKDIEWFGQDLASRKEEHTAMVGIGSRQHHAEIWGTLAANPAWRSIIEHAHDPACNLPTHGPIPAEEHETCDVCAAHVDCLLFPELRSMRWLEDTRTSMADDIRFEMIYQNTTHAEGAEWVTADDLRRCRNSERRIGERPRFAEDDGLVHDLRLVAGTDPAAKGFQASFLWAFDVATGMRYMLDVDNRRAGGLEGARLIMREWFERYGVRTWVVERNGYQEAVLQDRDIVEFSSQNGISLVPHYTDRHNKMHPDFGVPAQFVLFRRGLIDLPAGDAQSIDKVRLYEQQILNFEPETSKASHHQPSDVVMAAWFPETQFRNWIGETVRIETTDNSGYPLSTLGGMVGTGVQSLNSWNRIDEVSLVASS